MKKVCSLLFALALVQGPVLAANDQTSASNKSLFIRVPPIEKLEDRYRLVLNIPPRVSYRLLDQNDKRIWLRFPRGASTGSQILEGDDVVREVRLTQKRHTLDLTMNLGPRALSNDVYLEKGTRRLIVDVYYPPQRSRSRGTVRNVTPSKGLAQKPSWIKPTADKMIRTIVIDAGHGGLDCGAIGARGTLEKDINLKVAEDLADVLKKEKHLRVIMTRTKDEFLPLSQRTDIANQAGADLFISVHCNSSLSSKNSGFEAYFLSPDATDQAAEAVARIENSVVSLEKQHGKRSRLSELLASMAVYNFINESSKCAAHICREIRGRSANDTAAVREANFFVLRGAQMPGVLVELEYLSNPITELKLRSSRYRSQIAKALSHGILAYDQFIREEQRTVASEYREVAKAANETP